MTVANGGDSLRMKHQVVGGGTLSEADVRMITGVVAQPTKIDDSPHPGLLCSLGEDHRRLPVVLLEVLRAGHQVDKVVRRRDALHRPFERCRIENVALNDFRG